MIRPIIIAGLCLCGLCALPSRVRAQDTERDSVYTYVSGSDTLHYTYTPLAPEPPRRKPFLQRVVDYFGGSTVDRTFEKKIDFTFAGGPSYSKNTSLGIGLLAAGLYRVDRTDSVSSPSDVSIRRIKAGGA